MNTDEDSILGKIDGDFENHLLHLIQMNKIDCMNSDESGSDKRSTEGDK